MKVNADFTQRVLVHADALAWSPSPTPGVERRVLDRIGGEIARATTIVRFAPGSLFPEHDHGGGEEFIVLEGVFQDEHGDYPRGSYVRNPPTSRHRPGSTTGCTIFVKLWQFDPADRAPMAIDMTSVPHMLDPERPGVSMATLFRDAHETVRLEIWAPRTQIKVDTPNGAELLLLDGQCVESQEDMRPLSWLRIPVGGMLNATAGDDGARVWLKLGGLRPNAPLP